ncbi:hypothetical protein GC209_09310 [bacterium]|nr:hypothetical protein [bacterium]
MTRFVVDLGDIALSKDAQAAISADIQKVALAHIAGLHAEKPYVIRFPRDWWGFILRQDFEAMLEGEKALGRGILQTAGRM